jgi:phenylpropionate dioxygenase-like ring-hydroxylating dioxygenase large terminal subunit
MIRVRAAAPVRSAARWRLLSAVTRTAFHEDVAVFEAQQRNLLMIANPPQTDINADAGVIQARRILDRLYQEEQAAAATVAAAE